MNEHDFVQLAEEILESEAGSLKLSDNLKDVDWDSLADITFIAEADSRLGVVVSPERLKACETLADVRSLIGV
jgi:acyl carrier protein